MVLAICVIIAESTAIFGADNTSSSLRWIWEHLFGHVGNRAWQAIHHIIRKSGHFLGYGTMGLLWLRAWRMTLPRTSYLLQALFALLGTGLVASSDEFHQSFLPNRTGVPSDVLLDCSGAFVLLLLAYLILRIAAPKSLARAA